MQSENLSMPRRVKPFCVLILAVVTGVIPIYTGSMRVAAGALEPGGAVTGEDDARTGPIDVYVNDSFAAADAVEKAKVLAEQGRWREAAELLQQTADEEGDKLIRVGPERYVGVRRRIHTLIAHWPTEGIAAYRSVYEPRMQAELSEVTKSHSVLQLLDLFERYFCTASAANLADAIGQMAVESGDFDLAESVYRRVLEEHPDRSSHAQRFRAMLAILAAIQGQSAQEEADQRTRITWMGNERVLGELLAEIGPDFSDVRERIAASQWPIFGGNTERNRRSSTGIDELGLLWQFDDFTEAGGEDTGQVGDGSSGEARGRFLSMHPVVSDGLVFVQRGREVVALHLATGRLAWRFHEKESEESSLAYIVQSSAGGPRWEAVTVDAGRAYAALPTDTVPYSNYELGDNGAEIVCLDAATGALLWRVDADGVSEPFAQVTFDSSPVVRGGGVYVVGRRRRSFGFEDCYLYRFDASDGRFTRRTHLGGASTGTFGSRHASKAIPALHGDTVYISTNLGTVAAVSAHSGDVRWLRRYARDRFTSANGASRVEKETLPWQVNPAIWSDGRLAVSPTDSTAVMLFDAADGKVLQTIPVGRLGGGVLLGLSGDSLYTAGQQVCRYDLDTRRVVWSERLPEGLDIFGRGALLTDRVFIPALDRLLTFDLGEGRSGAAPWGPEAEGGNVLPLPDQLLVAGVSRISAYVRKAAIWTALRARMTAAPSDPVPALELAEIAFNNGEIREALAALAAAAERTNALDRPDEGALTRRIFDDAVTFAGRLAEQGKLQPEAMEALFGYAAEHAQDAQNHLSYRLEFARLFERQERPEKAVRLYQQILKDRSLRGIPVGASKREVTAGQMAEARIGALIETSGRSAYAPFEAEARIWLERGTAAGDVGALERVIETFPNSRSASLATMAIGDLLAGKGEPLKAAVWYSRCFHRYAQQVDQPSLIKKIADAYEQGGKPERAYLWLTKGVREYPDARVEHEGRAMTFRDYRNRLKEVRRLVEASRPRVRLPLRDHRKIEMADEAILLNPRFSEVPLSDWSRFFVYTPEGIRAYDAPGASEAWGQPAEVRQAAELLVARQDVAVFATLYEVFGLDVETGARRWSYGEYPEHLDRVEGDWEDGSAFRAHAVSGRRLISVRDDGQMSCVDVESGRIVWSRVHRPQGTGLIRFAEPWVVYPVMQEGQAVICVIDGASGEWSGAIVTGEIAAVEDLFVTLDGGIVMATTRSVSGYEAETGRRKWRVSAEGHLRRTSLLADFDALYFSDDGGHAKKISLQDGQTLWESQGLAPRGSEDLTIQRVDASLIVSTGSSVAAVDAVTGLTLWKGTTAAWPRFAFRLLSDAYLAAVDVPGGLQESAGTAYFYDHRNGGGRLVPDGGTLKLETLHDVRNVLLVRDALVVQDASTLHVWRHD